jgi:integrase
MFVTCGMFFGLRVSDILNLKWYDILGKEQNEIQEIKTKKTRIISITEDVQDITLKAYKEMSPTRDYIFLGYKDKLLSRQQINRRLKQFRNDYNIPVNNFSTHSLRKAFGRKVWETYGKTYEALILLMDIFNHKYLETTKRYLGITQNEISNAYKSLSLSNEEKQLIS